MTCFHPMAALQPFSGGPIRILGSKFHSSREELQAWQVAKLDANSGMKRIVIPCGQCIGCRQMRAARWGAAMMCESEMYAWNWFATLTHDDEHVRRSLHYPDVQAAYKRLGFYQRVRHGTCGEYGEQTLRPHYHAALFNLELKDLELWSRSNGNPLYRSAWFEDRIWPYGQVLFGELTMESAVYIAGYCLKKVTGVAAKTRDPVTDLLPYERVDGYTGEVYSVEPEFFHASKRPALGIPWLKKFHGDVWPVRDAVPFYEREYPLPRSFDRWLEARDPDYFVGVKEVRVENAKAFAADQTEARLTVREVCVKEKQARKDGLR